MITSMSVVCKSHMLAVLLKIKLLTFQLVYLRLELKYQVCIKQLNGTQSSAKE
jgi:hypothetical protein